MVAHPKVDQSGTEEARNSRRHSFFKENEISGLNIRTPVLDQPQEQTTRSKIQVSIPGSLLTTLLQLAVILFTIEQVAAQVHQVNALDSDTSIFLRIVADCPAIGKKFKLMDSLVGQYALGNKSSHKVSLPSTALLQCKTLNVEVFSEDYKMMAERNTSRKLSNFASNHIFRSSVPIFVDKYGQETAERTNDTVLIRNRTEINLVWMDNTTLEEEGQPKRSEPKTSYFVPHLETSQFWVLKDQYTKLKDIPTNSTFEIEVVFAVIAKGSAEFTHAMKENFETNPLMKEGGEQIKYLLVKNSKEYLIFFFATMVLHIVLQMLAFKNDIQYWKNVKNLKGVSMTMIWWDFAAVIIQLQYCLVKDAPAMMIWLLCFQVISTVYRIAKVYYKGFQPQFPFIKLESPISYQGDTNSIEKKVMKFLMMLMAPCFVIYFLYKAYYLEPEGGIVFELYQLLVASAMNFVAATEFVRLTPQLYLNYKLKTVPVMPWRTFAYKFVDAIIDDIANYAMGSPTIVLIMHLNDDFAFLVLIYQRWLYGEDPHRAEGEEPTPQIEPSKKDK